jgi:hypothetical protein
LASVKLWVTVKQELSDAINQKSQELRITAQDFIRLVLAEHIHKNPPADDDYTRGNKK